MPILNQKDFENAKRDIDDIGNSVNTEAIIKPRWGKQFKSIPLIAKEGQSRITELNNAINQAAAAGAGANGWTDQLVLTWTGRSQEQENKEFITSTNNVESLKQSEGRTVYNSETGEVFRSNAGAWNVISNPNHPSLDSSHKKSIYGTYPWAFDGYEDALAEYGFNDSTAYIYAGGFDIDEETGLLYVGASPSFSGQNVNYIAVYDTKKTGADSNVTWFKLPIHSINEGIVVTRYYGGLKLFCMEQSKKLIHEFDISTIPQKGSMLNSVKAHQTDGYNEMSFDENSGRWYVEANGPSLFGGAASRNNILIYDDQFNLIDALQLPMHASNNVQTNSTVVSPYIPKRQGFDVAGGNFYSVHGASWDTGQTTTENTYLQGVLVYSMDGTLLKQSLHNPEKMRSILRKQMNNPNVTRMEYEGCRVLKDGSLVSLCINSNRGNSLAYRKTNGLTIFRELCSRNDATDYTNSAVSITAYNFQNGWYPKRSEGRVMRSPYGGVAITSLSELLNIMRSGQIPSCTFSTGVFDMLDLNDQPIGSNLLIIVNLVTSNNAVIFSQGLDENTVFTSIRAGYANSKWSSIELPSNTSKVVLNPAPDASGVYRNMMLGQTTSTTKKTLIIDQQSYPTSNLLVIGGGSGSYASATEIRFALNSDSSSTGGTTYYRMTTTTFKPISNNTLDLGTSSEAFKKVFTNTLSLKGLSVFSDNTSAKSGGLSVGDVYRNSTGQLMVVF